MTASKEGLLEALELVDGLIASRDGDESPQDGGLSGLREDVDFRVGGDGVVGLSIFVTSEVVCSLDILSKTTEFLCSVFPLGRANLEYKYVADRQLSVLGSSKASLHALVDLVPMSVDGTENDCELSEEACLSESSKDGEIVLARLIGREKFSVGGFERREEQRQESDPLGDTLPVKFKHEDVRLALGLDRVVWLSSNKDCFFEAMQSSSELSVEFER